MTATPSTKAPSRARERLLHTASEIFYREGIHAVGVDRIVTEADITRATFYRHFPGKEALVLAYLERQDELIRGIFDAGTALTSDPEQLLEIVIQGIADDVEHNHTRGCPFINAAAEYPDASSPVRETVGRHREWFRAALEGALRAADRDDATGRARALVLLRDAALVGGYLDGADEIRPTFVRTARTVAGL